MHSGIHLLRSKKKFLSWVLFPVLLLVSALAANQSVLARPEAKNFTQASPIHPTFPLLDENGSSVLETGQAVSTMKTCGSCHDTDFIATHSDHANLGLQDLSGPGHVPGGRTWDTSPGFFGRWDPLTYRYLSPEGDARIDLTTVDWIRTFGAAITGGGPAVYSRSGDLLTGLSVQTGDPETSATDPETGQLVPWDWQKSGVVEMNCFLCHTPSPNSTARVGELQAGNFRWANTATLLGSGVVDGANGQYHYNPEAFSPDGNLREEIIQIQDPTSQNCGQCHGTVHTDLSEPLVINDSSINSWRVETTGQVFSPQRLSDSGLNLANKYSLTRSGDIHAERSLSCTDCHYSLNNPVYFQEDAETRPDHLLFDPRRLELGEYLKQPLHQFARGQSPATAANPELAGTMRGCESCHSIEVTHTWLPFKERHVDALSCETCHVPEMHSAALQQVDWTVLRPDASPLTGSRGLQQESGAAEALVEGYDPVLLTRSDSAGDKKVSPFNLVTAWFWVYGDPERPVRLEDLKAAWLEGDGYRPEVLAALDENGDGHLNDSELRLDSVPKVEQIADRLEDLGLDNPRIVGEVLPYSLNHNIATGEWATRECRTCHSASSRVTQPMLLAEYIPGGVLPELVTDPFVTANGRLFQNGDGELYYQPATEPDGLYILGHNRIGWIDLLGSLFFVGTLLGVAAHGTFRFLIALRRPRQTPELKRVYMYGVYERLWHWLQTFTILGLLFTGLVIHKPDTFGMFSFRYIVLVHNVLAAILLANAGLSLFYHLASGQIRQFIPRPAGFFDQAIAQGLFYLRGIFKGEKHPFEKNPDKKLNPLQQATYFGLLNVLLPLQVITGALMWGAQRWPALTDRLGGLAILAPFHTLVAWLFAAFIVGHVYLTTTGHSPLADIQAMMMGWEEVEVHTPAEEAAD